MFSIRKNVALGAAGTAVATAMLLTTAAPSYAAGFHRTIALRDTIPANTGSLLIERDGSPVPDYAARFCVSVDRAVNNGPNVYTGQGFTVTPYRDTACQGAKSGAGIFYRASGVMDGFCIVYGVNQNYFAEANC